jgi:hypothetical protein
MGDSPPAFPDLDDLVDLAPGSQIDMRPTLLRVLTDLYLQRPTHTPEDERYYTELALRLLDLADVAARAALAERLASYPAAPRAVIERLARDELEVATPILARSLCLSESDLERIAKERGSAHAAAIARRRSLPCSIGKTSTSQAPVAAEEALELSELFYTAGAVERRLILICLDYAPINPITRPAFTRRADTWRLEGAALQHNTEAVMRELESALGISRRHARRVVEDDSGELIVVAAKAMGLPTDVVQRLLLFMNPRIGHSVDRVYELARLFEEITVVAARRLIAVWRNADRSERAGVQHQPVAWRIAADNARRALSEVTRRPAQALEARLRG